MVELKLEAHCPTRPMPPHFAIEHGFCYVDWLAPDGALASTPPQVGVPASARVAAPFFAESNAEFLALYLPASIAANGWDLGDGEHLSDARLVRCAVATDLSGTLLDPRPEEKIVIVGVDRTLVICTMQGDVTFSFWLRRERPEIFLLEDTSICHGCLYSGNGRLGAALHARLSRV